MLAERTGSFAVLANLIRGIAVYQVERGYQGNVQINLALAPLRAFGQVLGKLERRFEAGDRLAWREPLLRSGGRLGQVGDRAHPITPALEVCRESKNILGCTVMRPLKGLSDAHVQAPAPSRGDLIVDDLLVQRMNERVLSRSALSGWRVIVGNAQKTMRSCEVLTPSFDRSLLTVDSLNDLARGERRPTNASRFQQRAVFRAHAVELEANHLAQVVRHFEP